MGRSFYGNEGELTTKPGVNTEISKELEKKEGAHGNVSFVEGMGVRTTPYLEKQFNSIRNYFHEKLNIAEAELQTQVSAASNEFNYYWARANGLIKDDKSRFLDISMATVLAAALVGRRAAPLRWTIIPAALVVTFKYRMPNTYYELKENLLAWEKSNFPDAYKQQQEIAASSGDLVKELRRLSELAKLDLQASIHNTRKVLVESWNDDE